MKKIVLSTVDKVLLSDNPFLKKIRSHFLGQFVPFNRPLKFKIQQISEVRTEILQPYQKLAFNHIGGLHACSLATLGELCAGMGLSRNLGLANYRPILADLHVHYERQAREDVIGLCEWKKEDIQALRQTLGEHHVAFIWGLTTIRTLKGEPVCEVKTHWQMKSWDKIKATH